MAHTAEFVISIYDDYNSSSTISVTEDTLISKSSRARVRKHTFFGKNVLKFRFFFLPLQHRYVSSYERQQAILYMRKASSHKEQHLRLFY